VAQTKVKDRPGSRFSQARSFCAKSDNSIALYELSAILRVRRLHQIFQLFGAN
jgi:hypothetical protein